MKWFQNLAFRYKLILPLGVVVLLFFLFAASTLYRIDRLGNEVANLVRADMPVITDLLQADRDLYQALVAERTLIFVDVGSANYTALAADHAQNVQQAYERVTRAAATIASSRLASLQDIAEKLQSFEASYRAWETLSRQVVESRSSDTRVGRATAIGLTLNEANAAFESMRDFLGPARGSRHRKFARVRAADRGRRILDSARHTPAVGGLCDRHECGGLWIAADDRPSDPAHSGARGGYCRGRGRS
jgi:methyl-accepting chemotaxis protein